MRNIFTVIILLGGLLCAAYAQEQPKGKDAPKAATKAATKEAPPKEPAAKEADAKTSPSVPGVTLQDLDQKLAKATGLLLAVFTLGTAFSWIVLAAIVRKKADKRDIETLGSSGLGNLATSNDLKPLGTTKNVEDLKTALDSSLKTIQDDLKKLNQQVDLFKGSHDTVLALVSRLMSNDPPKIASMSPTTGAASAEVVILGNNFLSGCRVWFGTVEVQPTELTTTSMRLTVPALAAGPFTVQIQGLNGVSAPVTFTVK